MHVCVIHSIICLSKSGWSYVHLIILHVTWALCARNLSFINFCGIIGFSLACHTSSSPANRDVTPRHDNVDSNRSPPPHVRAGDSQTLVAITAQVMKRCPQHLTRHRQTKSCQHPPEGTPTGSRRQPQS